MNKCVQKLTNKVAKTHAWLLCDISYQYTSGLMLRVGGKTSQHFEIKAFLSIRETVDRTLGSLSHKYMYF